MQCTLHVHKSYYQKSYITFGPGDVLGGVASIQITKIANMCVNILNYRILQPKTAAKEVDFLDVLAKGLNYFVETMVCGVCKCYDPIITTPVKNPKQAEAMMTTEWIGCDCN